MPDDDCRGGARDAGHAMVLREPEATIAPPFGVLCEIERAAQSLGRGAPLRNGSEVENGQRNHDLKLTRVVGERRRPWTAALE